MIRNPMSQCRVDETVSRDREGRMNGGSRQTHVDGEDDS